MSTFSVLILEDDPMVAEIEKQYIERNSGLSVAAIFQNGRDALSYLNTHDVDLILLDFYMPVMDGRQFLAELRQKGKNVDVIMITAANDAYNVKNLYMYGISDYLIKPFDYARFQTSMNNFISKKTLRDQNRVFTQDTLDKIILSNQNAQPPAYMEKGVQQSTVDMILEWLRQHPGELLTLDDLSQAIGLSRVTMRRYMNHLVKLGFVEGSVNYTTGGRPSSVFCYRP